MGRQSVVESRMAPTRTIWAARTAGGTAWKLAEGGNPVLSPDGRAVLYVKDEPDLSRRASPQARADDQRRAAGREAVHHGLGRERQTRVVAGRLEDRVCQRAHRPHADRRLRRRRRARSRGCRRASTTTRARRGRPTASGSPSSAGPGTPFGQQIAGGSAASAIRRARPAARRSRRAAGPRRQPAGARESAIPGLTRATFRGGYTLSFWVADVPGVAPARRRLHRNAGARGLAHASRTTRRSRASTASAGPAIISSFKPSRRSGFATTRCP